MSFSEAFSQSTKNKVQSTFFANAAGLLSSPVGLFRHAAVFLRRKADD